MSVEGIKAKSHGQDLGVVPRPWPFADFIYETSEANPGIASADGDGPECIHFSGFAISGGEFFSSAAALTQRLKERRLSIDALLTGTGYFTAVVRDKSELLLINDLLGLEHLYLFAHPGGEIVSNKLHALTARLKERGIERRPNIQFAAITLSSDHPFFRQCHSHGLAIQGLSLVPVDRYVAITGGRVELRPKPLYAEVFGGVNGTYNSLIEEAAHQILQNITAIRDSGLFDLVTANLSGGRDSRVVFGALLKLGQIPQTPIISYDIPGTRDLKRALKIIEYYRAPLFEGNPDSPQVYAEDPHSILAQWRSYYMGMYHKMYLPSWSSRGAPMRSIRLSGGSGEVFRSFWSKWFGKALVEQTPGQIFDAILDKTIPNFPREHHKLAADAITNSIQSLPGETLAERLDNHYLFFRNRMHFGMNAYKIRVGDIHWEPIVTPHLLLASRKLDWNERRTGKVLFDVLDRIAPELNLFEYAGTSWPEDLLAGARSRVVAQPKFYFDRERAKQRWEDAERKRALVNLERRKAGSRPFGPQEMKDVVMSETEGALTRIAAALPDLMPILTSSFFETTIASFADEDERKWQVAASKVLSVADLLVD